MGLPWYFITHGVLRWCFYGTPTVLLLDFHGAFIGFPWQRVPWSCTGIWKKFNNVYIQQYLRILGCSTDTSATMATWAHDLLEVKQTPEPTPNTWCCIQRALPEDNDFDNTPLRTLLGATAWTPLD